MKHPNDDVAIATAKPMFLIKAQHKANAQSSLLPSNVAREKSWSRSTTMSRSKTLGLQSLWF
ncbi:hypothetical protein E2542_SST25678 [Spatholobus suberectus]|nr:hypothetical protein E2542_SST25678 [Spatholobus suberectus]